MNKVDLFIPTFNRPDFLERILDYYNFHKVDYSIIVADSSTPSNKKLNRKILSYFPNLHILYIDKFSSNMNSHIKFGNMVKYAKSKYCVFCPDDDFIIPNGINKAVEFLENNSDYAAAHGSYISFYIYKSLFSKQFWWRFFYHYESTTSSDPLERLCLHLTDYNQVLWAVRRTSLVKTCYREFINSKVDPIFFGELLPDMLTAVYGKIKKLNVFYAARQAFSTSYSYWPSLQDAIKAGTYDAEFVKFRNCLISSLKKFNIPQMKSVKTINSNMQNYLKTSTQEYLIGKVNLILRNFPGIFGRSLRLLHAKYLFSKKKEDSIGLIDNPKSSYFSDFDNIRQLVLKYDK